MKDSKLTQFRCECGRLLLVEGQVIGKESVVAAAGSEREAFENAREDFAEKFDALGARIVARQGFHAGYELGMRQAARAAAPAPPSREESAQPKGEGND